MATSSTDQISAAKVYLLDARKVLRSEYSWENDKFDDLLMHGKLLEAWEELIAVYGSRSRCELEECEKTSFWFCLAYAARNLVGKGDDNG